MHTQPRAPLVWPTWLATTAAVIGYITLALASAGALTACGGGDDDPNPRVCYVEGKPMPPEACR